MKSFLIVAVFVVLTLSAGASQRAMFSEGAPDTKSPQPASLSGDPESPDLVATTSTFFTVRRDFRRCVSPICGGYFVKRVNQASTRCSDGKLHPECYVARIDWNGQPEVEPEKALLRGELISSVASRFGKLGALRVTESWEAAGDNQPQGIFFRVRDRGIRCVTRPCPTHHEAKLNTSAGRSIAGVALTGAGASSEKVDEAFAAMTSADGVLVAGEHAPVSGPAGTSETLKANQFYLRAGKQSGDSSSGSKPCMKTGCSSQICSDHNVISTCEWRAVYACYQKAICERQRNGECGFRRTPELLACIAKS
jgi:hypothetical protein